MRSFARSIILAAPCALLAAFITAPMASVTAIASPVPPPMPMNTAYSRPVVPIHATPEDLTRRAQRPHAHLHKGSSEAAGSQLPNTPAASVNTLPPPPAATHAVGPELAHNKSPTGTPRQLRRQLSGTQFAALLGQMREHRSTIVTSAAGLQTLASKSASTSDDDVPIQQESATQLTSLHVALLGFESILSELGEDKGLANYDKTDQIEVLLKDVINGNKDAMTALTVLIYNIPVLGPVLGPIVYEVKCILDDVLNITENLTDGLLGDLQQLLGGVIGQTTSIICSSNFNLAGLCL